jgi:hypothetical protein
MRRRVTENGEQGATAICTRAPAAAREARRAARCRRRVIGLDEVVRQQAAVRHTRSIEPRRDGTPSPQLALPDQPGAAVKDVVVVEAVVQPGISSARPVRAAAYSSSSSIRLQIGNSVLSHVKRSACWARVRVSVW